MSGEREQSVFLVSLPDVKNLCRVFLSFQSCSDEGELRNNLLKTCRELLLLCSDVIASPVLGSYGGISVIMAITLFKRGFIQAFAQRHCLQLGSPQRVLPDTLQACLSYSITARLAPKWNRAGQYLIAGKNFLCDAGKLKAVVLELSVNETQLCVSVETNTVRLPPALLEDFDVPPQVMKTFLRSREAVLHTTMPNNWCHILPSMKKGQMISVSRKMPEECPFKSYAELQNHWNNMYGYHLPPLSEDEVVYCSVYFKLVGEKLFTYPLSCIRTQPVQLFPRVDLQGVLGAFMSDLSSVVENICGFMAQMSNKPFYCTTRLNPPVSKISWAPPANLTTDSTSRRVLTQLPSSCATSEWPLTQPGCLRNITQTITTKFTTRELGRFQVLRPNVELSHCHSKDKCCFPSSCTSFPLVCSSSSPSSIPPSSTQTQSVPQAPKLVPIFKNKLLSRHVNITKILVEKQQKQAETQSQHFSGLVVKRQQPASFSSSPSFSALVNPTPSCSQPTLQRVTLPFRRDRKKDNRVSTSAPQQPVPKKQPLNMHEVPSKRRGDVSECQPKRPKVNIQDVDVVKYAKSNQLARINVATLQAWLRGQGVTVRLKDKKEELVSKVMQCLYEP